MPLLNPRAQASEFINADVVAWPSRAAQAGRVLVTICKSPQGERAAMEVSLELQDAALSTIGLPACISIVRFPSHLPPWLIQNAAVVIPSG